MGNVCSSRLPGFSSASFLEEIFLEGSWVSEKCPNVTTIVYRCPSNTHVKEDWSTGGGTEYCGPQWEELGWWVRSLVGWRWGGTQDFSISWLKIWALTLMNIPVTKGCLHQKLITTFQSVLDLTFPYQEPNKPVYFKGNLCPVLTWLCEFSWSLWFGDSPVYWYSQLTCVHRPLMTTVCQPERSIFQPLRHNALHVSCFFFFFPSFPTLFCSIVFDLVVWPFCLFSFNFSHVTSEPLPPLHCMFSESL